MMWAELPRAVLDIVIGYAVCDDAFEVIQGRRGDFAVISMYHGHDRFYEDLLRKAPRYELADALQVAKYSSAHCVVSLPSRLLCLYGWLMARDPGTIMSINSAIAANTMCGRAIYDATRAWCPYSQCALHDAANAVDVAYVAVGHDNMALFERMALVDPTRVVCTDVLRMAIQSDTCGIGIVNFLYRRLPKICPASAPDLIGLVQRCQNAPVRAAKHKWLIARGWAAAKK
jgi:hypothetical protein